ncbi:unnamed protein product [Didymodactylos carnosus]|uniref:SGNH hydrolase-type esterase domain-containing protein n=1 Tax=Didymodactylos carnosus TaxID=1234261 RepID=A0A813YZN3_9BILA|nr:unnamed protein product [Didymodactylos carnosus]CAF1310887.1 unnamed protein product [Didymodactylos carnosus]CAF3675339.1 unnamed protein product [Didymodactylos carnosus]CAF4118757.1 unnamed protein product [Didymodactylos carnosus]
MENKDAGTKVFKILAHGDSITRGYYSNGYRYHPYTDKLKDLLQAKYSHLTFDITTQGINGETTTFMLNRLKTTFEQTESPKYDCLIILGGLNDMGSKPAEDIARNLCSMVDLGRQHVTTCCFAVSVPYCFPDCSNSLYKTRKDEVNKILHDYIKNVKESPPTNHFVDLTQHHLNFLAMSDTEKQLVFDDRIHYSPEGYDRLGTAVYKVMKSVIRALK